MMLQNRLSQVVKKLHYPYNILVTIKSNGAAFIYKVLRINFRRFPRTSQLFRGLITDKRIISFIWVISINVKTLFYFLIEIILWFRPLKFLKWNLLFNDIVYLYQLFIIITIVSRKYNKTESHNNKKNTNQNKTISKLNLYIV